MLMKIFCAAMAALFLCSAPACASSAFEDMWEDTIPLMNEGVEIVASGQELDERSLSEMVTFRKPKFQRIVQDCFEVLAQSPVVDLVEEQQKVFDKIADKKARIVELQSKLVAAPEAHWNPLSTTKKSINEDIEDLKQDIDELLAEFEKKKEAVFEQILALDSGVTRNQLDALFKFANGEDTASVMAVAQNLREMHENIEKSLMADGSGVDLLQQYTGIYMMCHQVYMYALEAAMLSIDESYLVKLDAMRKESYYLLDDALKQRKKVSKANAQQLEANIKTNRRVLEVIDIYERYLKKQQRHFGVIFESTKESFAVAVNTYHTVKLSSDLLGMMRSSEDNFALLFDFKLPELSLMYDERLSSEFEKVTNRLRAK